MGLETKPISSTVFVTPTILDSLEKVETEPYIHAQWFPVLPVDDYNKLMAVYPSVAKVVGNRPYEQNARYDFDAAQLLQDDEVDPIMRDFIETHTSNLFWQKIVDVFGDAIREKYPYLEASIGKPLEDFVPGVRNAKRHEDDEPVEVELDAKPGYNTAVERRSSVRGPHVDNPLELFAAIMYCKPDDDPTIGGDFIIHRALRQPAKWRWHGKNELQSIDFARHDVVQYGANTGVALVNELLAVHSVTQRPVTNHPRRLMNFIAELRRPLFAIPKKRHRRQ